MPNQQPDNFYLIWEFAHFEVLLAYQNVIPYQSHIWIFRYIWIRYGFFRLGAYKLYHCSVAKARLNKTRVVSNSLSCSKFEGNFDKFALIKLSNYELIFVWPFDSLNHCFSHTFQHFSGSYEIVILFVDYNNCATKWTISRNIEILYSFVSNNRFRRNMIWSLWREFQCKADTILLNYKS